MGQENRRRTDGPSSAETLFSQMLMWALIQAASHLLSCVIVWGGRRNLLLLFQLVFQWAGGIAALHCARIVWRMLGPYSNKAYQRPRGTPSADTHFWFIFRISAFVSLHRCRVSAGEWSVMFGLMFTIGIFFLFQVYTRYGKCYTFNGNKTTSRKTKQGGMGNGLEIMLDIQQDEYLPIWRETSKLQNCFPL